MSYNPNRQSGTVTQKRARRLDPRAGVHHSDIIAKYGPAAATVDDIRSRQQTPRGWKVVIFKGDDFEMVYEYICSRNSTGVVKHSKKDRAFKVLGGDLFLTINNEVVHLRPGSSYAIPKGTEYQLATSGTADAEIIFCQGPDYDQTLKQISSSEALNNQTNVTFASIETPRKDQASIESAKKYAEQIQERRRQRDVAKRQGLSPVENQPEPATSNDGVAPIVTTSGRKPPRRQLAGQQVMGINPRPMGPAGFGED